MGGYGSPFQHFGQRLAAMAPGFWIVWAGAAVITLALVILMHTRWGQQHVGRKCVLLSLFAHVVLVACLWSVKIVGAPGPPGEDGSLLVTHVKAVEEPDEQPAAARPWHTTPLRARDVPTAGPERTRVELSMAPERTQSEPRESALAALPAVAEPLSPRVASAVRAESAPAEHLSPAALQEAPIAPRPASRAAARLSPSMATDVPRERLPIDLPTLTRPMTETSDSLLSPARRGDGSEPQPLTAVDRSLISKAKTPSLADDRAPATGDGSMQETNPQARSASARQIAGGNHELLSGDLHRPQPAIDLQPATTTEQPTPRRHVLPKTYELRVRADRQKVVERQGGSPDVEAAVRAALAWLAANQEAGGQWDAGKHGAQWDRTRQGSNMRGPMRPDTGVTGLALLAFLGAGHTHQGEQYQDNVRRALDYLVRVQAADGNLSGGATLYAAMYCHGMATLALAEAYGMTGDAKLLPPLRRAIGYTLAAQIRHDGGWRYRPNDEGGIGDTSQFGWQLMALKAAEVAGLDIPVATSHGMQQFLARVTSGRQGGLAGYRYVPFDDGGWQPDPPTPTMTAEALFCRLLLGTAPDNPLCQEAADYLLQNLPGEGQPDLYYWYYGTLALYRVQGQSWPAWNRVVQKRILNLQERNGSWPPDDRWGSHGGRVFTTAMATLTLEVYYRYGPAARAD
jgi:hypothetical protein